jgi:hypothetical protein
MLVLFRSLTSSLFAVCVLVPIAAGAASWQAELEDGRQISVDPKTNRAVIVSGAGQGAPLWDGVHRLSDGGVVTVRSGLMVPNEAVIALREGAVEPPAGEVLDGDDSCDALVLLTCGMDDECADSEPCELARQLRGMQWAVGAGDSAEGRAWAQDRCRQGLADPQSFPNCTSVTKIPAQPCQRLLERTCGKQQRCERSEACQLAKELTALEAQAAADSVPAHAESTRQQCYEVLQDHAFFPPCR